MATDTTLRPGEIKDILLREIEAADLHELDVEEVGTVLEVKDGIARIYGLGKAMAGEMLEITSSETGNLVTALALNLEEDNIGAVVLGDYLQLKEGDEVRRTSRVLEVPVGPEMVGRVVDALGRPIDGQGDIPTKLTRKVESEAPGIIVRQPVKEPLQTGHQGHRLDDPDRPRTARAHHRRPRHRQDRRRDRYDHQSEGPGRLLRLRRDRSEGVDRRVGRAAPEGSGRDGLHHRRRRLGVRPGSDAVHRALLGLRDGRVLHVQRRQADVVRVRRFAACRSPGSISWCDPSSTRRRTCRPGSATRCSPRSG